MHVLMLLAPSFFSSVFSLNWYTILIRKCICFFGCSECASEVWMGQDNQYLDVVLRGSEETVSVPVFTSDKPFIPEDVISKWQAMVDILIDFSDACSGLIARAHTDKITVLVSSNNTSNPFSKGFNIARGEGAYCEEVLGRNSSLLVSDVSKEPLWKTGPVAAMGLVAYYGLPVQWPDGDFFGSICLHDNKPNSFTGRVGKLIAVFKDNIEKDLSIAYMNFHALKSVNKRMLNDVKRLEAVERDLLRALEEKELLLDEVYFRIRNNLQLIAGLMDMQMQDCVPAVSCKLNELKNCLMAIKVVHDLLREGDEQAGLNLNAYLGSLVTFIGTLYASRGLVVTMDREMDGSVFLSMKQATLTGLIVNQVLSDLAEHRSHDGGEDGLALSADGAEDGDLTIRICGTGTFGEAGSRETGKRIVQSLSEQLSGRCGYPSDGETLFYLRFPL